MGQRLKWAARPLALLLCSGALAQTAFDDLAVDSYVREGIGIGRLINAVPLPEGDWLVVARRTAEIKLDNGRIVPRHFLTLKNNAPNDPIAAMVLAFTPPGIIDVNWTNNRCESKNPKDLVDDFGGSASDLI